MKRVITFALVAVMLLCAAFSVSAEGGKISVVLVTDTGGVNDESFNQLAWQGLQRAQKELGIDVSYVESKTAADYAPNLNTAVDEKPTLILGVGFMMADAINEAADANPDQMFALIDQTMDKPNVLGINFKTEQNSYLVGVVAGTMTKTKNVGFVIGMVSPTMDTFGVGYYAGVLDACPDCKIQGFNANNFGDAAGGKAAAINMYTNGADIIFHAAGGTGMGVIEAATEEGKYAIGVDQDQSRLGPKSVITSAVKRVDNGVFNVCKSAADGSLKGGNVYYDLANGGVDIAPTQDLLTDDAKKAVEAARAKILSGELVVPASREDFVKKYGDGILNFD